MPQAKTGIATTILAPDPVGDGFVEISPNKTLFVQKFTNEDPIKPKIVEGLQTVEQVFEHFKPNCDAELVKEDGSTLTENFKFSSLGDFDIKNFISQSDHLRNLSLEKDAYLKIVKQLKSNKSISKGIENQQTRIALINALKALVAELEVNDQV